MQLRSMILTGLAGAMASLVVASTCSAQMATDPATTTTATTTPAAVIRKPATATPQMIDEAIQRTQARAAKFRDFGIPEQFGSEEPFTYKPGQTF